MADWEFDPAKDAANVAKHGISLSRAAELDIRERFIDRRFEERRLRAYGVIDDRMYCLAYTIRGSTFRAISLRRAHRKEYEHHVRP